MKETSSIHSAEYVKEFFDSVAERYDDYKKRHGYYHNMIANVYLSSIPPGSTVIDFGCGTGELLGKLNPRSGCGIDFSPKMISAGRARLGDNVRLLCEEFGSCCPGERYDYAVISNTLEYVYDINALLLKACGC